jgi:hypothetical protein
MKHIICHTFPTEVLLTLIFAILNKADSLDHSTSQSTDNYSQPLSLMLATSRMFIDGSKLPCRADVLNVFVLGSKHDCHKLVTT